MDDESRHVSLRLSKILENVGISERMRHLRRKVFTRKEIQGTVIYNFLYKKHWSKYVFGSSIEGTTTTDMNSDVDLVHCNESELIIDHIEQVPAGPDRLLLAFTDFHTRPGYVKLQVVKYRAPCTIDNFDTNDPSVRCDNMGRICLRHCMYVGDVHMTRGGPADTLTVPGGGEADMVYAYRSRAFPHAAIPSLLELFRTELLSSEEVEEMIQYGCLYVGVGHPSSDEKELEWRISFSLQERKLMFKLNPTQHQCYVLLKLIKTMLTSEPDIGKSITSYHCKTCLFRQIAKTRLEYWTPENLIACTLDCLTELLQCLHNDSCPNFFIKTNNMFERRVYGEVKDRLIHRLSGMLKEGYALFYCIESDYIGQALLGHVNQSMEIELNLCFATFAIHREACSAEYTQLFATELESCTKEDKMRLLPQLLGCLSSINTITEHTQDETKAAIRELKFILHKFYAAHLASLAFSTDTRESEHHLLQASARHLKNVMTCDLMTGRLLYASILYRQGNIDMCCSLLEQLEQSLHEAVQTICACNEERIYYSRYDHQRLILSCSPDPETMIKSSIAVCMIFLPSDTEIIPAALQFELYRSVATPPESWIPERRLLDTPLWSRRERHDDWFDLAVVDSKVYLYFLQYLVYSRLNRSAARRLATDNLLKQLQQDWNLGHRETGYNLLGWIYSQEGHIEAAAYCFLQSWRIRPHHNAAKWHMLVLIYRQYVARR